MRNTHANSFLTALETEHFPSVIWGNFAQTAAKGELADREIRGLFGSVGSLEESLFQDGIDEVSSPLHVWETWLRLLLWLGVS